MPKHITRRTFVRYTAYAGAALSMAAPRLVRAMSPNGKLNIASIGVAGKGWEDLNASSGEGLLHNVVAICDVDHRNGGDRPKSLNAAQLQRPMGIGAAAEKFTSAKVYADFRRMFDEMHGEIDAVTVSTPDHMHATIALTAMHMGKHVYVQKPLTHTVHEARVVARVAAEAGVVTQMGNQFHSSIGYRCLVEVVRSGVIGKVREAHAWTSSPSWPQGLDRPVGSDAVPSGLDWDLWLGVSQPRPYKHDAYAPFNWRGFREFGTGAQGDMGCHVMDPVVWSLSLQAPLTVRSLGPAASFDESYPAWTVIRYEFPATEFTAGPLVVTWHDGGKLPPLELARMPPGQNLPANGSLYIGEKGTAVVAHTPTVPRLYPEHEFSEYSRTALRDLYKGIEPLDHYRTWTEACTSGKAANSGFDYAGPLTETVLLGNVAHRFPGRVLKWDRAALRFSGAPDADAFLRRSYRKGWEIGDLA